MAMLPMNWRMVDKCLGCWVVSRGVVGFVFKFGRNWSNFDVSTSFLVCEGGVVSVRERCPRWCRVRHPCTIYKYTMAENVLYSTDGKVL